MFTGSKRFFIYIFILVFFITFLVGIASEVSLVACVGRAFFYGTTFLVLVWLTTWGFRKFVIPDLIKDSEEKSSRVGIKGSFDVTVADEHLDLSDLLNNSPNEGVLEAAPTLQQDLHNKNLTNSRQIDPTVNNIIKNDPNRVAQIVKKMGFEEE